MYLWVLEVCRQSLCWYLRPYRSRIRLFDGFHRSLCIFFICWAPQRFRKVWLWLNITKSTIVNMHHSQFERTPGDHSWTSRKEIKTNYVLEEWTLSWRLRSWISGRLPSTAILGSSMCSWRPTSLKLSIRLMSFLRLSKRGLSVFSNFYILIFYLILNYEGIRYKCKV